MECPYCGSTEIINDYFENEWLWWCGHCGRRIDYESVQNLSSRIPEITG